MPQETPTTNPEGMGWLAQVLLGETPVDRRDFLAVTGAMASSAVIPGARAAVPSAEQAAQIVQTVAPSLTPFDPRLVQAITRTVRTFFLPPAQSPLEMLDNRERPKVVHAVIDWARDLDNPDKKTAATRRMEAWGSAMFGTVKNDASALLSLAGFVEGANRAPQRDESPHVSALRQARQAVAALDDAEESAARALLERALGEGILQRTNHHSLTGARYTLRLLKDQNDSAYPLPFLARLLPVGFTPGADRSPLLERHQALTARLTPIRESLVGQLLGHAPRAEDKSILDWILQLPMQDRNTFGVSGLRSPEDVAYRFVQRQMAHEQDYLQGCAVRELQGQGMRAEEAEGLIDALFQRHGAEIQKALMSHADAETAKTRSARKKQGTHYDDDGLYLEKCREESPDPFLRADAWTSRATRDEDYRSLAAKRHGGSRKLGG